mmetsp:Transcript_35984/g.66333  ORF Transcript_35984/g.66333 Transcript_35984/m.66333 type:complete len:203 (-) Transcript_35984:123-731(-)
MMVAKCLHGILIYRTFQSFLQNCLGPLSLPVVFRIPSETVEEKQRRNGRYSQSSRHLRIAVDVELHETDPSLQFSRDRVVLLRHARARSAPRREGVHHERSLVPLVHHLLEMSAVDDRRRRRRRKNVVVYVIGIRFLFVDVIQMRRIGALSSSSSSFISDVWPAADYERSPSQWRKCSHGRGESARCYEQRRQHEQGVRHFL